uniref:Dehydrogenase/reductase SDR family member 4 n=1 Tax=Plectus sambesii TaxID=2011161 RepID=A0A914VDP1_9BILA
MSQKKLQGKVAIVTAATKGIGEAIAERLAQDGAKVVISSRRQDNVDETVGRLKKLGLTVAGIVCHVGNAADRAKLIDFTLSTFGRIDILVNNAGINPHFGHILDISEEVWDKLFDVNVKAAFMLCKLVVPHMEKVGGGSIVFNASIGGYKPPTGIATYGVTKTTLLGLTKALAVSLVHQNIRVNGIAPGIIKTHMSRAVSPSQNS